MLSGLIDGLAATLRIVFFVGALFVLQWDLALVALLVGPLFFIAARRFSRLVKHAAREQRRRSGSLSAVAEESLANPRWFRRRIVSGPSRTGSAARTRA